MPMPSAIDASPLCLRFVGFSVFTVVLPGAGHALLHQWGQAFFRAVLAVVWAGGGLSLQYVYLDDAQLETILRAVAKQDRSEEIAARSPDP